MTLNISVVSHAHDPQGYPDVELIQTDLKKLGFYPFAVDGDYGDHSRSGCVGFQRHVGIDDDGIVGPETFKRLQAAIANLNNAYTTADKAADMMLKWVTTGNDGTRPVYSWGAKPSLTDNSPDKSDCSGGTSWVIGRIIGHAWVQGSVNQYNHCKHITVAQAIKTKGALLFSANADGTIHHVAFSMGNGKTAECRSSKMGCGSWDANDGRFNRAALVPELHY